MWRYLEIIYIALPAFAANAAPVLANRWEIWKALAVPVDGNAIWQGMPLLGKHKTWRGVLVAMLGAAAVALLQYMLGLSLFPSAFPLAEVFMTASYGVFVGVLCMVGDMVGSFFKRRLRIQSGKPFIPMDQINYMIVFLLGTWPMFAWKIDELIFLLIFAFFINTITNFVAYVIGIKSTYW
jgi:CDP-2,3-bis-(O-geranylgeranyl)-sn-glycerol synthase